MFCSRCLPQRPDNLVFHDRLPLVRISKGGSISAFSLGTLDPLTGQAVVDKRIARQVKRVWLYSADQEILPSEADIRVGAIGCSEGLVLTLDRGHPGLLSTKPMQVGMADEAKVSDQSTLQMAGQLLDESLKRHGTRAERRRRLAAAAMQVYQINGTGRARALFVEAFLAEDHHTLSALLIAEPDSKGRYRTSMVQVTQGGAEHSEGAATRVEFLLYGAMSRRNWPEVLIRETAYESIGVTLLQRQPVGWRSVGSNGVGC